MRCILVCWLAVGGVVAGCGGAASGTGAPLGEEVGEVAQDVPLSDLGGDTGVEAVDLAPQDVPEETTPEVVPEIPEILEDVPIECDDGNGCFGELCLAGEECFSGWCGEHIGEGMCTVECQEACPGDWLCTNVIGPGPELVAICLSQFPNLCKPCWDDTDCVSLGDKKDVCVSYGTAGGFCGAPCEVSQDCPNGYDCEDVESVAGASARQCVDQDGVCECTNKSRSLGLDTFCSVENEWGSCGGARACLQGGLEVCGAGEPAAEACNGLDDDCDEVVDECDDADSCTTGDACVDGKCKGGAIACDDGNPCTSDSCDTGGGCIHKPVDGPCDDGNECTTAEQCAEGVCKPLVGIDCDDGDFCTTDSCDLVAGCVHVQNTAPCNDGDVCTTNDECDAGTCVGGAALNCDDGNSCTLDACDAVAGCVFLPGDGACDDGNECTADDTCLWGQCTGLSLVACDDGNVCTADSCEPASGCVSVPITVACDDLDKCTSNDLCIDGKCKGGAPVSCADVNPCTDDFCVSPTGCEHVPNASECDDGDACSGGDVCSAGVCAGAPIPYCGIGSPCKWDEDCVDGMTCVTQVPGGYCVKEDCNGLGCPAGTSCMFEPYLVNYVCMRDCEVQSDCREDEDHSCTKDLVCWCGPVACVPGLPMCDGQVATVCNECGSGPVAGGTDCLALDMLCEDGVCLDKAIYIDFDDLSTAGCSFVNGVKLTNQYSSSKGVTFSGPTANDLGAVVDECAWMGVTGHSSPKFLAFNTLGSYPGGGKPIGPEEIEFTEEAQAVKIWAGSTKAGEIKMTAHDAVGNQLASDTIVGQGALQEMSVYSLHISKVVLSFSGTQAVFDDLVFY